MCMCSIAGFSLSVSSRVNPRQLSKALFVQMDSRGAQAAGYAWQSSVNSGVFKKDVSGAELSMKQMSKGTRVAVLHTRYATHGSTKVMANNHPVLSPDRTISLVHNGVIYNHHTVRGFLDASLPEVDSSVIPAILEQFDRDVNRFDMLDGDASVAWLDESDRLTLQVARVSHSPLCVAQLEDGSFVFASTEPMLMSALRAVKLVPVFVELVPERTLFTVRDGRLDAVEALPEMDSRFEEVSYYSASHYRNLTSGNKLGTPVGSDVSLPRRMPSGEVFIPSEWYDLGSDYGVGDYTPVSDEFPKVAGYDVNEFGEYFDQATGVFCGSYDDLVEWGELPYGNFSSRDFFA